MADERAPREPRTLEGRETETRDKPWEPASMLPDPEPQDGWVFRWIRTSMVGNPDNTNVSKRFREGWEPVRAEDHPELHIMSDHNSDWSNKGGIEVGGLLLCKAAEETVDERRKYYAKHAQSQMQAVDNAYMRENDPRMPVLAPDRKTRVAFGGGSR
ncbi:hypothetical protein [Thalassospira alkalitolerans]|jgi:hypothetical protein|uniref:hypothetical protein n=1 Tax=Thalassospira alkalitolerans TaxID=1293890 RepID=UPI0030EE7E23|tara:strand:- start:163 stop:633 length:471 start_codon:yes stop_codon:yes gene_type:complete